MTIKITLVSFFTLIVSLSTAQETKTMELKGIYHHGLNYYYDLKKVDGGAYGLQIPLQSLNDTEINRRYKSFRKLRSIESVVIAIPVVYLLSVIPQSRRQNLNATTFWTVYGTSVLAIIGLEIAAKHHLKKGIDRYNQLIISPGSASLGAAVTYKF
jgi:hypothetical protein